MKVESVRWKKSFGTKGIDAAKAYQSLESLRKRNNGNLTDDSVLKAAQAKNHVLHNWFTWDDTEAATEYRRRQARDLIGSLEVVYVEAPAVPSRAFEVHRKTRPGGEARTAYRTTEEVLRDPKSRDDLIASAIRMAMEFRRRFRGIHELDQIINAIDATVESVGVDG